LQLKLAYGKKKLTLELEDNLNAQVLKGQDLAGAADPRGEVDAALRSPFGSKRISQMVSPSDRIVVIVNDITRPAPTEIFLDALSDEFQEAGLQDDRIVILVSTGTHRANTSEELENMLGCEAVRRFKVINHDCRNREELVHLGETKRGVPIWMNKMAAEASLRILTGITTPHHVAGYSGTRKSLVPGVCGFETIKVHHSFPIRPFYPSMGELRGNPFHEEALEGAKMAGPSFVLNAIPNDRKEVFKVVAGGMEEAHHEGVKWVDRMYRVGFPDLADIVITCPNGYPRDINLYQAQKALSVAETAVREGGIIILVAECRDGTGGEHYIQWLKESEYPKEVVERFQNEGYSSVGASKAFMFARALLKSRVIVVSDCLSPEQLHGTSLEHSTDLSEAVRFALAEKGPQARVLVLPDAINLIPDLETGAEPRKEIS
jgi:nickel-dependent lactate racemase